VKNKVLFGLLVFVVVVAFLLGACAKPAPAPAPTPAPKPAPAPAPPVKDAIVIGMARSYSGPLAPITKFVAEPIIDMWLDEVNARGGIYVAEYGKKLPVKYIKYDDKSDRGTMVKLMEKLVIEDKVDLLFGPTGTGMLFAAVPVANKLEAILLPMEGGAASLKTMISEFPWAFTLITTGDVQGPVLADVCVELGMKTVAMTYCEDLHGYEYRDSVVPAFVARGIDVVMLESHPLGIKDLSPVLKKAKGLKVDVFYCASYPAENYLATKQAIELDFNPKVFAMNVGGCWNSFRDMFGANVVEGVIAVGAFSEKSGPGVKEFRDKFIARYGEGACEHWGHICYWVMFQHFENCVDKAGTLDPEKLRDVLATETSDTAWGPFRWVNGVVPTELYCGQMGQWLKGMYEVIDPGAKRTATPIIKPPWPK